ncbi:hypothetical protein [Flavobacterium sp.]|uniref:hypothetical protein n=1 Tax=Flavobacterium sp. TaxID=239 RepID=UPI003D277339
MKKTIFLFLALITIVPFSHAQSDATLEETIEWLNEYGKVHESVVIIGKTEYSLNVGEFSFSNSDSTILIIQDITTRNYNEGLNMYIDDVIRQKYFLYLNNTKLITLKPYESKYIIELNGDLDYYYYENKENGQHYSFKNKENSLKNKTLSFVFNDGDTANSTFKAIKHLSTFFNYTITFKDKNELKNKF